MTPAEFRKIALALPGAEEGSHMGHADFRVGGKIFATLGYPDRGWGMIKLPLADQDLLARAHPETFVPAKGGWGESGATTVQLKTAKKTAVQEAMRSAWEHRMSRPKTKPKGGKPR